MRSMRTGQGYLIIDSSASGNGRLEADIIGCRHCQKSMLRCDWAEDGGFCHRCDAAVCGPCADKMLTEGCRPFMQRLDQQLSENYRREQNAKLL